MQKSKRAIIFLAWGEEYIKEVEQCVSNSTYIKQYDLILITDEETVIGQFENNFTQVIRTNFYAKGLVKKAELIKYLPTDYASYLLLDSDTIVIDDIGYGFEMAEKFELALSPAPHYSLDYFWGFDRIMEKEGVECRGQLQYNTGVIFFKNSQEMRLILQKWMELAVTYQAKFENDQPFFTLALLQLGINPYTLSISYNYRGFGDAISGIVRIWHSHEEMPENINVFNKAWPPRRAWPKKVKFHDEKD
jgi:lipopolysaccharide biosynthesis glycosyltransferase